MILERVVPLSHEKSDILLAPHNAEIKAQAIPVHMQQVNPEKNSTNIREENPQHW